MLSFDGTRARTRARARALARIRIPTRTRTRKRRVKFDYHLVEYSIEYEHKNRRYVQHPLKCFAISASITLQIPSHSQMDFQPST